MKHTEFVIMVALVIGAGSSGIALAQTTIAGAGSVADSTSTSSSGSIGLGVGGGGGSSHSSSANQNIVGSGNTYEAADLGNHVPTMFIPNLTTSNGTCANSFSMGGSGAGFGVAFGKTYVSGPCNARFNANQLNSLGKDKMAMEVMCGIKSVYEADQRLSKQYGTMPRCVDRDEGASIDPVSSATEAPVIWFDEKEMGEVDELAMLDSIDGMSDEELGLMYAEMYAPKPEDPSGLYGNR